ncbi:elongation factor P maturation arginine rhamnosyltransferase EarP [Ramlibacter sp. AN1015]|uniref:elongation factor P maturation arginine rhamnosyltransferase EarP n=1 Tax=Ramlibacter sp. AN1015 TaxID=3133428 RepID=UPI0030BE1C7F
MHLLSRRMRWDIFCKVIDNHGDIGVCWRLSAELARRGEAVRLWVDEPSALAWMAPGGHPGVQVVHWGTDAAAPPPGDVVVEAFGCDPHPAFAAAMAERARATGRAPVWINLEYLSAEPWVERCHLLPSPVLAGPAQGLGKRFFYPGFTPGTGGLLRERDLDLRQRGFDRSAWRARMGAALGGIGPQDRLVSLFCYEPPALAQLLRLLAREQPDTHLLVTAGRARAAVEAVRSSLGPDECPNVHWLPLMTQPEFDELLWGCDLNFVRGEDSLVRALWAGRPFVWQIYPQEQCAHRAKLDAFLDWFAAPPSLRSFHAAWNAFTPQLPALHLDGWEASACAARARLLRQHELVSELLRAVRPG